ncbi:MAG: hypothetical protein RTU30_02775 [Candidatus Thorarchaeota archaeon]
MMIRSTPKAMLYKAFALLFIIGLLLFVSCWIILWGLYLLTIGVEPTYEDITYQVLVGNLSNIGLFLIILGILGLLVFRVYDWAISQRTVS